MDMIVANSSLADVGIITNFSYDYEAGIEKKACTFEVDAPLKNNIMEAGYYVYAEGKEYGGRIDSLKIDTAKKTVAFKGRTWRGILGSKILEPASGQAYYTVSGDLNTILGQIITKVGLSALFSASSTSSGITSSSYQFDRYINAYEGIIKLFTKNNAKLCITYTNGTVALEAKAITCYTDDDEITSDEIDFVIEQTPLSTNHMIGLGSGTLTSRQVVHKYVGQDGTVTNTKYYTGCDEITEVYDDDNCESLDELKKKTEEKLIDEAVKSGIKLTVNNLEVDIGDKITAREINTGIAITQYVTDKIVKIENGIEKISYKVGEIA